MKNILLIIALAFTVSACKKNACQTCMELANYSNGTTVRVDTIFKNRQLCGDELATEKAKNGKSLSGANVITTVYCK